MKYIATMVFDSDDQNLATLYFQNASIVINEGNGCQFEIAHIKAVINGDLKRPTLQTVQVLRPEDFSTWDRHSRSPRKS